MRAQASGFRRAQVQVSGLESEARPEVPAALPPCELSPHLRVTQVEEAPEREAQGELTVYGHRDVRVVAMRPVLDPKNLQVTQNQAQQQIRERTFIFYLARDGTRADPK